MSIIPQKWKFRVATLFWTSKGRSAHRESIGFSCRRILLIGWSGILAFGFRSTIIGSLGAIGAARTFFIRFFLFGLGLLLVISLIKTGSLEDDSGTDSYSSSSFAFFAFWAGFGWRVFHRLKQLPFVTAGFANIVVSRHDIWIYANKSGMKGCRPILLSEIRNLFRFL